MRRLPALLSRPAAIVIWLCVVATGAAAAPFVPANDAVKLEELPMRPTDPIARRMQSLRSALAREPGNLRLASEVARRYILLGRASGDPRYDGYAEAALAPWWTMPAPPREALLLRATLRQHIHEFDAALADLALALSLDPRDPQARLTRATVLQVRGEFDAALRDCESLAGRVDELIFSACVAGPGSMHGRLRPSFERLRASLERHPEAPVDLREWVLTLLAELAERAGMEQEAQRCYEAAFALDPSDPYLIGAFADFLLDLGHPRGAAALTEKYPRNDALLLRHALALKALGSAEAPSEVQEVRDRFEASRMRSDRVHLREQARYMLQLAGDAQSALALARENWATQKEAADARILMEAARAARDPGALSTLRQWLLDNGDEDERLAGASKGVPAAGRVATK